MKKIFALLAALAMTMMCAGAMAERVEVGGLWYELSGATATVDKYTTGDKYNGAIVIPAEIEHNGRTYKVTSIAVEAFWDCDGLTSVTIPGSVTSIGNRAFQDCDNLTSVTISEGVETIGLQAFYSCDLLESLTIPSSVTYIDSFAFEHCHALKTLTFAGDTPPVFNSEQVIAFCRVLEKILVPKGSEEAYRVALSGQRLSYDYDVDPPELQYHDLDMLISGYERQQPAAPADLADLPRTGDSSSLALWMALLAMAGAGMMARRKMEA